MIDEEMKKKVDGILISMFGNATGLKFGDVQSHLKAQLGPSVLSARDIDKSLQRLRKAGKIQFGGQKAGWSAVVTQDASTS